LAVALATGFSSSGTASAVYTLAAAPVITSPTSAFVSVNFPFSYQITASGSPTSYSASGLPAGLSINTSTGLITGTLTTPNIYSIVLGATNSSGTGHATLTLTVSYYVQSSGASGASAAFGNNVTVGDALYSFIFCGVSPCTITVSSTHESGWTTPFTTTLSSDGDVMGVSCAVAAGTSADTVNALGNGSAGNISRIQIYETSGTGCNLDTTVPASGRVTTDSTQTTPITSGSITTTTALDLMFYYVGNSTGPVGANSWTAGTNFSNLTCVDNSGFNPTCSTSSAGLRSGVELRALNPAGTSAATITSAVANSAEYGTIYAAFRPSGFIINRGPSTLGLNFIGP